MDQAGQGSVTQKPVTSLSSASQPAASQPAASLPTPDKKSSFAQWQEAYNVYFTHYARMSPEYAETGQANYRARARGVQWAHQMVDASLGVLWHVSYAGTPPKKRDSFWKKLKDHSVFLMEETGEAVGSAASKPDRASGPKDSTSPQRSLGF